MRIEIEMTIMDIVRNNTMHSNNDNTMYAMDNMSKTNDNPNGN